MSDAEELGILVHRASKLGFKIVDLYMPDGDEVIAFTCSKSKDYIEAIQKIDGSLYRDKAKDLTKRGEM